MLVQHPAVRQAAVFGTQNRLLGDTVNAAIVLRQGHERTAAKELVDWCAARLAYFKVPSKVHFLEALPTTGSGKVLKRELKAMLDPAGATNPVSEQPMEMPHVGMVSVVNSSVLPQLAPRRVRCQPSLHR